MPDGSWRLIDLDGAVKIGDEIGAKALSTAFMPPESTRVQGQEVVFRIRKFANALVAHPTLDIWSFMVVLFRAIAHKPLIEADDRDNLRSKREAMILETWGANALSDAIADARAALVADGANPIEQLAACDLLEWGLQRDPAARPQSFEELLAHPFFASETGTMTTAPAGLRTPPLHVAAALGNLSVVESMIVAQGDDISEVEPLLGRHALHLAAASGQVDMVQLLIEQPTVDAGFPDAAGHAPLDHAQSMLERHRGNAEQEAKLNAVVDTLMQADLLKQIERQATEGVTCGEGQRVRNYFQSQNGGSDGKGSVDEYWPEVIISYATGTRMTWSGHSHDLDGEGCGPGMMYCHLIVRYLSRAGIPCFTGLHVEGGYNWHVYFEKLRHAKVMIVVMSPAFFKSAPCFHEQLEARRNGLQVIPLLFELEENGNPPGAVTDGGAKWIEAYEKMVGGEDEQVAHDTLCAFRLRDDHDKGLKLNSEPAPPNTMLNSDLLGKLVKRVRRMLDGSDTGRRLTAAADNDKDAAAADGGSLQQLAERDAKIAELEAKKEGELAAFEKQLAEMAAELEAEKKKKGSQPMMKGSQPMMKGS